jgi:uncharacterized membrane protein
MNQKLVNVVAGALAVTYPILALVLVKFFSPYWIIAMLVLVLLIRLTTGLKSTPLSLILAAAIAVSLIALTSLFDPDLAIRLYPVFMTATILIVFAVSLFRPPSMIERFARILEPDLPEDGVRYTYRVTQIWCAFFVFNIAIALWTAFYASLEIWALYNGLISYVLMGILLGGEFVFRKQVRKA